MTQSFAQFGTDLAIAKILNLTHGVRYLDIGASDPVSDSNTYYFYLRGGKGVTVEPVEEMYSKHVECRPHDTQVNAAVSDHNGFVEFHQCDVPSVSSLESEVAAGRMAAGFGVRRINVPCYTARQILEDTGLINEIPVDFASIDVEGHEYSVLKCFPFDVYKPRLMVLEACIPCTETPNYEAWEHFLLDAGYAHIHTCGVNRIYIL